MNELFIQYQNYILSTVAFAVIALLAKLETARTAIVNAWNLFQQAFKFIGDGLTESNGKTSYSRLAGSYVIYKITAQPTSIPEEWMTLFMVLIGYQLISGLLKDNPALVEFIKARYGVAQQKQSDPAV